MRNLLNRVSDRATQHLHQVWKEYRDVDLQVIENGDSIDAHVKDRYNTFDLARRSDGFKRFVAFLLHVSAKARTDELKNTLLLDDEPDVGLHPSGARYLRDELVKVSKNNYVVYATHSIFMVDGDHLESHSIVSKDKEVTTLETANESNFSKEEVLLNALGYSLFEHLSATNLIFEGWRDKRLFEVAAKAQESDRKRIAMQFQDVGRCFAKGAKDVPRIAAILELARRDCVIVSDSDSTAREQQRGYKNIGKWLRYDQILRGCMAVTGEDFVVGDAFLPVLEQIRSEQTQAASITPFRFTQSHGKLKAIAAWLAK
jgi:hypothetical protein